MKAKNFAYCLVGFVVSACWTPTEETASERAYKLIQKLRPGMSIAQVEAVTSAPIAFTITQKGIFQCRVYNVRGVFNYAVDRVEAQYFNGKLIKSNVTERNDCRLVYFEE